MRRPSLHFNAALGMNVPPGGHAGQRRPAPMGRRFCATPRVDAALAHRAALDVPEGAT